MLGGTAFKALRHLKPHPEEVVDVGCGTGVATIQLARLIPSASIIGLDISPAPDTARQAAPTSVTWVRGNILDIDDSCALDMTRPDILDQGSVDYAFGRMLFLGINDWQTYAAAIHRCLKPSGIIEHQDLDWSFYRVGSSECLSDGWLWHKRLMEAVHKAGLSSSAGSEVASHLQHVGMRIIGTEAFEFSFVPSSRTADSQAMGTYVQKLLLPNFPELLRKLMKSVDASSNEVEQLTADCLRDVSSEEGIYMKYTVTIAERI